MLIYSLFFSILSFASLPCNNIDLRDSFGPPTDQGDTGFCFAHTSADLISQKFGVRVSPLDIAGHYFFTNFQEIRESKNSEIQNFLKENPKFLNEWDQNRKSDPESFTKKKILSKNGIFFAGGVEDNAIFSTNAHGLCLEERVPTGKENYNYHLSAVQAYHRNRLKNKSWDQSEIASEIGPVVEPWAKIAAHSFRYWMNSQCGDRILRTVIPAKFSFADDFEDFQKKIKLGQLHPKKVRQEIFAKIDSELNRRNGVAIGFSLDELMKPDPRVPGGDHSAIIAAREFREGKCWYFVRNSFGEHSSEYYPKFQKRFERGGVWILPEEVNTIYSAVWLN